MKDKKQTKMSFLWSCVSKCEAKEISKILR